MTNPNSAETRRTSPKELQDRWCIEKDAYYGMVNYLKGNGYPDFKAHRDKEGAWLDDEQVAILEALRTHIEATGKMEGFSHTGANGDSSSGGDLALTSANQSTDLDIPTVEAEYAEDPDELDYLVRGAAELKTRDLMMPHLLKLHMASQMREEDLPPDLRAKLEAAREAASPKTNPAGVASQLLNRWRSRSGN